MRTASKFRANLPNFHQIPAYVALFREKTLIFSLFGQKLLRDETGFDRERSHDLRLDARIPGKEISSILSGWRPSYEHLNGQHTPRVLQHTPGFSNTHFWRSTLTGSLQPRLRTPIHCVHYWGKSDPKSSTVMQLMNCHGGHNNYIFCFSYFSIK